MAKQCPYCGDKIKDNAKFCDSCGGDLREDKPQQVKAEKVIVVEDVEVQDIVRCPHCGSTNVQFVTKTGGADFSPGRACCGYTICGTGGLLCGIKSGPRNQTVRKCMKCDHEF